MRRTATQHDRAMTAGTGTASWACVVTGPGRGEGGGREGGGGGANPPSQGSLVFRAHTHTHRNECCGCEECMWHVGGWGAGGLGLQHPGSARVPARAAQPCGGRQPPPRISPPAHPPAVLPQFSRTCTGPAAGMTPPPVYAGAAAAPTAGPSWEAGAPWLYLRCRCSGRHSPRTWAQNTSRMFRAAFSSLWGIEQGKGGGRKKHAPLVGPGKRSRVPASTAAHSSRRGTPSRPSCTRAHNGCTPRTTCDSERPTCSSRCRTRCR